MSQVPIKVSERIINGIKKFQPILAQAKTKDINEADTVILITDMLSEIFGYDKYSEVTSEFAVKKSYCDLAIKLNNKLRLLLEIKAIGIELKDYHIQQAVDYGANAGVEWVLLTNGHIWKIFKIIFAKPIEKELIYHFDLLQTNPKNHKELEQIYFLSKEGMSKQSLDDFLIQKETLSKFFLGQIILNETIIESIKKILRKVSPDVRLETDEIRSVISNDIIKRDVLEGPKAQEAHKKLTKIMNPPQRKALPVELEPPKITVSVEGERE